MQRWCTKHDVSASSKGTPHSEYKLPTVFHREKVHSATEHYFQFPCLPACATDYTSNSKTVIAINHDSGQD